MKKKKWDTKKSYLVAKRHGFKKDKSAKTGYYDFADIDDDLISIHHYLKWYKFGFTRLHDNLSIEIRNKRITRNQALNMLKKIKNLKPETDIKRFCKFTKISRKEFEKTCEKFRNMRIWFKKGKVWMIRNYIIPNYKWK